MQNRILFFLMAFFLAGAVNAQENLSLTLEDAQEYALEHNRTIKNASMDVKIAEASRWQTLATMLPQVNVSADYSNMFGYSMDLGNFQISMPNSVTYGGTASVAISGTQVVGVQLENIAKTMADISLKQTEQEVTNQVKTLYYSALVMEETVSLLEKNLENLEQLYAYTQRSVEVGISEQTDADLISVQIAAMSTNINSTKRSLEMVYNSLRLQLGLKADTGIGLTQTIDDLMAVEKAVALLDVDFMLDRNYNYQLLEQNVTLSKKQVSMKKWEYAPSIQAFYQYTKKEYMSDEATMNSTPPNMFGISLNIPIFSSGSRYKAVQEARLGYRQQLNTFDDTRESLIIQHRQLSYNLTSSYESYETQKKNMVVVQRVFDNVSRKYEQGMASSLDVTNSGTELIGAQSSYVQALLDVVNAQVELEKLLNMD
ncbi:TolC family protein [Marinilabilia sp.]|uniref:TolC family protein n=1 Tax=Marinilabilia sp. TaxID=2021252 RepID=UPI0025BB3593|nr:TolC family protein [Marinilabilia sp.]